MPPAPREEDDVAHDGAAPPVMQNVLPSIIVSSVPVADAAVAPSVAAGPPHLFSPSKVLTLFVGLLKPF